MTRIAFCVVLVVLATVDWPSSADAQAARTCTLRLDVSLAPRSALRVSASRLQFDVAEDGRASDAVVDYRVAARTRRDGGVLLTVEPGGALAAAGRVGRSGLTVRCDAEAGAPALIAGQPLVVARWRDGGVREGKVRCRLDGAAAPGRYWLPVTFAVILD